MSSITLGELAEQIGATLDGDGRRTVTGCAGLTEADPQQVSFLSNPRYVRLLHETRAAAVILSPAYADKATGRDLLLAEDPYRAFREAMLLLHEPRPHPEAGVSARAYVDAAAELGRDCTVRPFVYIAPGARLGDRVIVYPNCYIGKNAEVGDDSLLYPGVCVYDRCVLGRRVVLHAGTVIGQDGFGYASSGQDGDGGGGEVVHHKIPQAGRAVVGGDVEMGANCCVDRAAVGDTQIGVGSKLSDGVVIGHGAKIGRHNLLVGQVGIAGSTVTGDHVSIGGQAGIAGHLNIGAGARIAAGSKVMHDIPEGEAWGGIPAGPLTRAKRTLLQQQRLPQLVRQVADLEQRLRQLEAATTPTGSST